MMRIASTAKSNTEILSAIGVGPHIIAATEHDAGLLHFGRFEAIGNYIDIDVRRIAELHPDMVFTSTALQEKYAHSLENMGIAVVHFDPVSVDGIMDNILQAGNALGVQAEARVVVSEMKAGIKSVAVRVSGLAPVKLYCEEWPRPPMASGNWVVQMIEIAGGKGILTQGERSREVNLEEVEAFSPEKIALNWCGIGLRADTSLLTGRKGWEKIHAVSKGRISVLDDSHLNTPSHNVVKGIRELAEIMHLHAFTRTSRS